MTTNTVKHTPLLPCPFCGGRAQTYHAFPEFDEGWHVDCDHDDACILRVAHGMFACEATECLAADAWNRRAPAPMTDTREWPEREDGVDAILADYRAFISARPMLTSLLYDIDMLPEQCVTRIGAIRLAGLCEVWRKGEAGDLPPAPQEKG